MFKERDLDSLVRSELKRFFPGIYVVKNHGDKFQESGRPDVEGNIFGRHFGIELKTKSRFSPSQKAHLKRIHKSGGIAGGIVHLKGKTYWLDINQVIKYSYKSKDSWLVIGNDKKLDLNFLYRFTAMFLAHYNGDMDELNSND